MDDFNWSFLSYVQMPVDWVKFIESKPFATKFNFYWKIASVTGSTSPGEGLGSSCLHFQHSSPSHGKWLSKSNLVSLETGNSKARHFNFNIKKKFFFWFQQNSLEWPKLITYYRKCSLEVPFQHPLRYRLLSLTFCTFALLFWLHLNSQTWSSLASNPYFAQYFDYQFLLFS